MQRVEALVITREDGREIETKTIDMHVRHPIAQAVHHQLKDTRVKQIKSVTRPSEIDIKARILTIHAIVCKVVDPAEAKRRTEMISFSRMIVDHVQNHLDACCMQLADHRLELEDLFARLSAAAVLGVRREKSDRVVAPIIRQPAIN